MDGALSAAEYWEDRYASGQTRWSGRPNPGVVAEVETLTPGSALDLGCGEGGDAIWLAGQGWTVTAVDISPTALATAARHAGDAAVTWERHDLAESMPAGTFDLVVSTYLHSPVELPRREILLTAAGRVAAGGTLLVIGHAPSASHRHADLPSAEAVVADLVLPADAWRLHTCEHRTFEHAFRDESPHERVDGVVRYERIS